MAANAFAGAADILGDGIEALFANTGSEYSLIPLDMIEVRMQIRSIFEDEENLLEDLAASIRARGVLQPILLRPIPTGYELVAGERRFRAARLAGLEQIPSYIRELSDEEAEDAQLAENIHRKNLTQIEEAQKIQRDLDRLGSVEAVLEKYQKSRPWLSKTLGLLRLPEQAKRLVVENVSADVEVINGVRTIEKTDPSAARELVDDLKRTRGKENAREKVALVKESVKPGKDRATTPARSSTAPQSAGEAIRQTNPADQPPVFAPAKTEATQSDLLTPEPLLTQLYDDITAIGMHYEMICLSLSEAEFEQVILWLRDFYHAGVGRGDTFRSCVQRVLTGLRKNQFGCSGPGALALSAFLQGRGGEDFDPKKIFDSLRVIL